MQLTLTWSALVNNSLAVGIKNTASVCRIVRQCGKVNGISGGELAPTRSERRRCEPRADTQSYLGDYRGRPASGDAD